MLDGAEARDIHSWAEPDIARVTHVDLNLTAHFDSRTMQGTATLDVQADAPEPALSLDTRDLNITAVTDGKDQALPWHLATADAVLGAALRIELGAARRVKISESIFRPDSGGSRRPELSRAAGTPGVDSRTSG